MEVLVTGRYTHTPGDHCLIKSQFIQVCAPASEVARGRGFHLEGNWDGDITSLKAYLAHL